MNELQKTCFAISLDPLHVGAGGYRLGRVDNTIVRDPGTNLPKIPGSSISGVCRNYAIYGLDGPDKIKNARDCALHDDPKVKNNCGQCIICQTFGFASGKDKKNQMGLLKFFDAMITAFPVATMCGPVWVSTPEILQGIGAKFDGQPAPDSLLAAFDVPGHKINLGWLYMSCQKTAVQWPNGMGNLPQLENIQNRLVIAPSELFAEIVNANLEVRTSVSIDFATGAAKSGALFTYEAIPRATLLNFDIVVDSHRCTQPELQDKRVWEIAQLGLERFAVLGLGGMNTRGFGRMQVTNLDEGGK